MPAPVAIVIAVALGLVGLSPSIPGNLLKLGQGTLGGAPINKCDDFEVLLQQFESVAKTSTSPVRRLADRKFELIEWGTTVEFPSHNCKHVYVKEHNASVLFEEARSSRAQSLLFRNHVRNDAFVLTISQFEREYQDMMKAVRSRGGEEPSLRVPRLP